MITRISGTLLSLQDSTAEVDLGNGLTYALLVPGFVAARLGGSLDQPVTLHTLQFFEGNAQGSTMYPRLAGFMSQEDRAFFELFITCKGLGPKKALRAMSLPTHQIAGAIADRDATLLQSLPEIGKRTAETIIVSLRGKVDAYLDAPAATTSGVSESDISTETLSGAGGGLAREALGVLLELGENRQQALQWIDRVLSQDDAPRDASAVVTEVYRIKAGG